MSEPESPKKNPAAVSLGRKGGKNSRKYLTEEESAELGRKAALARWGTPKKKPPKKATKRGAK